MLSNAYAFSYEYPADSLIVYRYIKSIGRISTGNSKGFGQILKLLKMVDFVITFWILDLFEFLVLIRPPCWIDEQMKWNNPFEVRLASVLFKYRNKWRKILLFYMREKKEKNEWINQSIYQEMRKKCFVQIPINSKTI